MVAPPLAQEGDAENLRAALTDALANLSLRDAVAQITAETGRPRREVYRLALEITGDEPDN